MLLSGCAWWRPANVPLRSLVSNAQCDSRADTLLVLLPGSFSMPEEFQQEGFVETVRARRLKVDVVMVDAHVGYYQNRSIVERLADDVVRPARAAGYRHIWMAGISIGGLGAMLYADAHPDELEGVVLLAPYLGTRQSAQEIRLAGGLARWHAPARSDDDVVDATVWRWLQTQTFGTSHTRTLPLFLGYGRDDRFAYSHAVLSEALPPTHVFTAAGGHDWPAWKALWKQVLAALPLPADPSCAAP